MGCFLSKVRTIADAAVKAVCDAASALWASIARAACKVVSFFFCLFILLRSVPHGCLCRCAGVRVPEEGSRRRRRRRRRRHLLQPQEGKIVAAVVMAVVAGLCVCARRSWGHDVAPDVSGLFNYYYQMIS